MEWFQLPEIVRLFAALAFVVALMGGLALLLKKLGLAQDTGLGRKDGRLKIVESINLDHRRRLTSSPHLTLSFPPPSSLLQPSDQPYQIQSNTTSK